MIKWFILIFLASIFFSIWFAANEVNLSLAKNTMTIESINSLFKNIQTKFVESQVGDNYFSSRFETKTSTITIEVISDIAKTSNEEDVDYYDYPFFRSWKDDIVYFKKSLLNPTEESIKALFTRNNFESRWVVTKVLRSKKNDIIWFWATLRSLDVDAHYQVSEWDVYSIMYDYSFRQYYYVLINETTFVKITAIAKEDNLTSKKREAHDYIEGKLNSETSLSSQQKRQKIQKIYDVYDKYITVLWNKSADNKFINRWFLSL